MVILNRYGKRLIYDDTYEPQSGIELSKSQRGCPLLETDYGPGHSPDAPIQTPSSRSTMYTEGDVLGTDEAGLRAAYSNLKRFRM